jgi:hypothetical protein
MSKKDMIISLEPARLNFIADPRRLVLARFNAVVEGPWCAPTCPRLDAIAARCAGLDADLERAETDFARCPACVALDPLGEAYEPQERSAKR